MPQSITTSATNAISTAAIFSNGPEPPPWPSGVNLQPERPGLQVLQILSSSSDNAVHPPAFHLKKDRRLQVAEFYSARGWEIPPLPWTNLSPPFSDRMTQKTLSAFRSDGGAFSVSAQLPAVTGQGFLCGAPRVHNLAAVDRKRNNLVIPELFLKCFLGFGGRHGSTLSTIKAKWDCPYPRSSLPTPAREMIPMAKPQNPVVQPFSYPCHWPVWPRDRPCDGY